MKKLEISQMENLQGGDQRNCFIAGAGIGMGLIVGAVGVLSRNLKLIGAGYGSAFTLGTTALSMNCF